MSTLTDTILNLRKDLVEVSRAIGELQERKTVVEVNRAIGKLQERKTVIVAELREACNQHDRITESQLPVQTQHDSPSWRPIEELQLSTRARNCLYSENIYYIEDLVTWNEVELMKIYMLGKKSLCEIKEALAKIGLTLD